MEEKEEAEEGKRKDTIASAVAVVRQPPTDSLRSLHAGLRVPTGRRRLVGANKKKEKKKNGKELKKNWQAARNERRISQQQNRIQKKKRGGNCRFMPVRSFGSTPSTIVYAPIIFPHGHAQTHQSIYRGKSDCSVYALFTAMHCCYLIAALLSTNK